MKATYFDTNNFSKDLLQKRVVELRIDMKKAGDKIGISSATLCRMENKKIPDVYTYFLCCKWLGNDMTKYFTQKKVA